jgi:tRNA (guanine-N7-)-methyltransferase
MIVDGRRSRSTEAFFGRRRGKTVRPLQAAALGRGLALYRLDLGSPPPARLGDLFGSPVSEVRLEIGFGAGEHLTGEAARFPSTGFIGVEPFVNSMAKMMSALEERPLPNLRVHDDDATRLLDWLPGASVSGLDLLYPDPWPKKKHWKRRFVNPVNLERFARVLKPGGTFRFASDVESYVNWTLLAFAAHDGFEWLACEAADWHTPFGGWTGTRYEAKALREGRTPAYLTFARL